ncbi:MAG: hypothetical protein AABX03_03835 [Nanoarchaeota archaeon]
METRKKEDELKTIFSDIKSIKIQGATNIAKAAIKAYTLSPKLSTLKKLKSLRPTEPMLKNVLDKLEKLKGKNKDEIISHFSESQDNINSNVLSIIKNNNVIFTHCHSTNVIKSLIYCKKQGKKFQVYNTETRPLFQGRKTAVELSMAGIKVTNFVDSSISIALEGKQGNHKTDFVFLGADAILKNGDVINKVGSNLISEIAKLNKIPVYIIADSWKFTKKNISLEQRDYKEVWHEKIPSNKNLKIKNPAFEKIPQKNISYIISEFGVLTPKEFVKKAR